MADNLPTRSWLYRGLFLAICFFMLLIALLPLSFTIPGLTAPDFLICIAFAWVLRRPEFVPFWSLLLMFLLADVLQMRPLGLWTAIALAACEFLRTQSYRFRDLAFPFEWAFVAVLITAAIFANRLILSITLVPQPGITTTATHAITTVIIYPVMVFLSAAILRVRKVTAGEAIVLGQRL